MQEQEGRVFKINTENLDSTLTDSIQEFLSKASHFAMCLQEDMAKGNIERRDGFKMMAYVLSKKYLEHITDFKEFMYGVYKVPIKVSFQCSSDKYFTNVTDVVDHVYDKLEWIVNSLENLCSMAKMDKQEELEKYLEKFKKYAKKDCDEMYKLLQELRSSNNSPEVIDKIEKELQRKFGKEFDMRNEDYRYSNPEMYERENEQGMFRPFFYWNPYGRAEMNEDSMEYGRRGRRDGRREYGDHMSDSRYEDERYPRMTERDYGEYGDYGRRGRERGDYMSESSRGRYRR